MTSFWSRTTESFVTRFPAFAARLMAEALTPAIDANSLIDTVGSSDSNSDHCINAQDTLGLMAVIPKST
ncbi:MAG TPA: hypothetical protein VE954_07780 [Oligoflexus sp.]|uniref:hypothetical protein n=1 Tax=Oligoflexus sp. TaxID=1971216 RepID=UPI002D2B633D|nr:hypothetical protein [Oligoflexus sp.]HYX33000.1 hypothetical protein [Oligoflexus sp.]